MAKGLLYDAYGAEIRTDSRVPARQAETGRVRDHWAGRTTGEVTPESLARALAGRARFQEVQLLAARMLDDDHVFSCMRNLANAVSRLAWEVQAFDDSAEAEKDAKGVREFLYGIKKFRKLQRHLIFGEFYPVAGAALAWNREYLLDGDGWKGVDPWRWQWDDATDALRILTLQEPYRGEPLDRRGFVVHSASLEPGPVRRRGLWRKVAWLWLFKNFTWPAWVRFAEQYGQPYIFAFARAEDRDSVLEAVTELDANARGVFPPGTELKLQEAQRYGSSALYEAIKRAAEEGMTKVILGHVLNTDAKSGSGTLAGNAAADVSQANKEAVADGVEETTQSDLVEPYCLWHFGRTTEIPQFTIKADPPEDGEKKAKIYVSLNESLAKAGKAIDPSQIEDEFGVRTIDVGSAEPAAGEKKTPKTSASKRRVASAKAAPRIKTADDLSAATAGIVRGAVEEMTASITAKLEGAKSIEEFQSAIWEAYGELDPVKLASGIRDASLAGSAIGRGEAGE